MAKPNVILTTFFLSCSFDLVLLQCWFLIKGSLAYQVQIPSLMSLEYSYSNILNVQVIPGDPGHHPQTF